LQSREPVISFDLVADETILEAQDLEAEIIYLKQQSSELLGKIKRRTLKIEDLLKPTFYILEEVSGLTGIPRRDINRTVSRSSESKEGWSYVKILGQWWIRKEEVDLWVEMRQ
jgi:hypothetical protein